VNLQHPKREPFVEVVLEDGRFARIRRPTRGDWVVAFATAGLNNVAMALAIMTTRITTIDGEPITIDDWLSADAEFTAPISEAIDRLAKMANENPNRGGVA